MVNKWDLRFLSRAIEISSWSKDPSTKNGSVIAKGKKVVSEGYNGYPAGVIDRPDDPREVKYEKTIHAEINAVLSSYTDVRGCTLYTTPLPVCSRCAAVLIQVGISRVVMLVKPKENTSSCWQESYRITEQMFNEAGIIYEEISYDEYYSLLEKSKGN
jgi:dCMP deaminase